MREYFRFLTSEVPGFENARRFIIMSLPEHQPFHWMESVDGQGVRFAIINPLVTLGTRYAQAAVCRSSGHEPAAHQVDS